MNFILSIVISSLDLINIHEVDASQLVNLNWISIFPFLLNDGLLINVFKIWVLADLQLLLQKIKLHPQHFLLLDKVKYVEIFFNLFGCRIQNLEVFIMLFGFEKFEEESQECCLGPQEKAGAQRQLNFLEVRSIGVVLFALDEDLLRASHPVEGGDRRKRSMESRVTANYPSRDLKHNALYSSKVSDKVHERVNDSFMSNLVNLKPEILLRNDVF
jgi:hypothetical protein